MDIGFIPVFSCETLSSLKKMEKTAYCALNRIFGFKPALGLSLIRQVGSAYGVFCLHRDDLRALVGPDGQILNQISGKALDEARIELEKTDKASARFICHNSPDYPALLKECSDPPIGLYFKSDDSPERVFSQTHTIAVVGTRDMSLYGKDWCKHFLKHLSESKEKIQIVSGLAYGIDICAHLGAIENGLATIAVLPTGVDRIYPSRHIGIAERIIQSPHSALVSDYPIGTAPLPIHFLRRNRIIAGLSKAVILVESRAKGGGMTTARLAASYDRELYALPGRIGDIRSQGCNLLIRERLAEPLSDAEEMVEKLGLIRRTKRRENKLQALFTSQLEESQRNNVEAIIELIRRENGIDNQTISRRTGLPYGNVVALTEFLSAEGIIEMDFLGQCHYN